MMKEASADPSVLEKLTQSACSLGAGGAAVIRTTEISIEEDLAMLCREPKCESYGLSAGCPPHVAGPAGFRELLKHFAQAVVFKIEVPSEVLLSNERTEVFRLLHETAAAIERLAVQLGYPDSKAFAGGSCKRLFCGAYAGCRVLSEGGECRNPDLARPSMSGFGVNVSKLMQAAGWTMKRVAREAESDAPSMGTICGLILIG